MGDRRRPLFAFLALAFLSAVIVANGLQGGVRHVLPGGPQAPPVTAANLEPHVVRGTTLDASPHSSLVPGSSATTGLASPAPTVTVVSPPRSVVPEPTASRPATHAGSTPQPAPSSGVSATTRSTPVTSGSATSTGSAPTTGHGRGHAHQGASLRLGSHLVHHRALAGPGTPHKPHRHAHRGPHHRHARQR